MNRSAIIGLAVLALLWSAVPGLAAERGVLAEMLGSTW
jgi:hypothetical protein